jgi:hypothetical protein
MKKEALGTREGRRKIGSSGDRKSGYLKKIMANAIALKIEWGFESLAVKVI